MTQRPALILGLILVCACQSDPKNDPETTGKGQAIKAAPKPAEKPAKSALANKPRRATPKKTSPKARRRVPVKKNPAKKAPVKKAPAKKAPVKKTSVKAKPFAKPSAKPSPKPVAKTDKPKKDAGTARTKPLNAGTQKAEPKPKKAPAERENKDPDEANEDPRLPILRGLLSQKERRIANLLRELAAARDRAHKAELAAKIAIDDMASHKRELLELRKEVAKARAGLPLEDKGEGGETRLVTKDKRYAPGGVLDPSMVVARINGQPVTAGEFMHRLYYNYALDYYDSFLRVKMVDQEAQRLNITVEDKERIAWAARNLARLSSNAGGDRKFRKRLKGEGKSVELVEALLRSNAGYALKVQKIIQHRRQLKGGMAVVEALAQHEYKKRYPNAVRASHIFWATKAKLGTPEYRKIFGEVEAVDSEIRAGKSFATMARRYSQDEATRARGGRLGVVTKDKYKDLPALNSTLFSLKVGTMTITKSKEGFHLVKVTEVVPPEMTWKQARPGLVRELTSQGPTRQETDRLLLELQKRAEVKRLLKLR